MLCSHRNVFESVIQALLHRNQWFVGGTLISNAVAGSNNPKYEKFQNCDGCPQTKWGCKCICDFTRKIGHVKGVFQMGAAFA